MHELILKYEVLVSGIYPFEGHFEKNGFLMKQNIIDEKDFNTVCHLGTIYISPYLGCCTYPNNSGKSIYLTLQKELTIEIDYSSCEKEYDLEFTNHYLNQLNLFKEVETLEKIMTNANIIISSKR